MPESRRFVRLPILPSWEKLLSRLYVLPDSAVDRRTLRLELLGLASKESVSLPQLFSQLCVFLPKLTGCEGVVIWTIENDRCQVVASNLSPKKSNLLITAKAIARLARDGQCHFNKHTPVAIEINQKLMTHYQLLSLGNQDCRAYFLLSISSQPIATDTTRVFETIKQILALRIKTYDLANSLQQQEIKLANLTHQLGEGMAVMDHDLKITLWNRSLRSLTGFKSAEVLGKSIDQILPSTTQANWFSSLVSQVGGKGAKHVGADLEIITKDHNNRWISCLVSIYRNDAGHIEQVVLVARDISHRKVLEKQKNEFISIATHELRTPITAIRGYLNLLERKSDNFTDKQQAYLAQTIKASNRLANLAEDLLKVVQIEQDRIQFKPQMLHLGPLIKKVTRDFKHKAASKGLTLSLSKLVGSDLVQLDPERAEQIFANLIDNAIKYTNRGSVKIILEEISPPNSPQRMLAINFRDTGIGIGLKNIEEIFEKFHRAHRPEQSREQGAGLGLYIVKSFVEKQGGKITVKSRAGKGTQFTVTFPLVLASQRSKR